jgi:hypothetical protein
MLSRKDIELKDGKDFYNLPVRSTNVQLDCLPLPSWLPARGADLNVLFPGMSQLGEIQTSEVSSLIPVEKLRDILPEMSETASGRPLYQTKSLRPLTMFAYRQVRC